MDHTDTVLYLYPYNDNNERARKTIEASSRHVPPRLQRSFTQYSRGDRCSTEPPEDQYASALDYLPCLPVTLGNIPRTDKGLVFGYNQNCDVVVPERGVSNFHFSLTFDQDCRPIIKDLGSLVGTQVTYNGKGQGTRSQFQWVIGGHYIPQQIESIVITIPSIVSFQVIVPFHNTESPEYINAVNVFKQGRTTADSLLSDLGIVYPETRFATGANTPDTGEIYLKKKLGKGGFGIVTRWWNVSSGSEFVVKTPTTEAIRGRKYKMEDWRREARVMEQVSHPHIVRLLRSIFTPHPELRLEYVPLGSLDNIRDVSSDETSSIVSQCLSALTYLHTRERPIAHRDIKPGNILVQHRFDGDIYVKLGDFGVSRDRSEMATFCGTRVYLAPEVYSQQYTPVVDIWSLGVVACELTCGLPKWENRYKHDGTTWCKKIRARLRHTFRRKPSDLAQFLLNTMVILSPEFRCSAAYCLDEMAEILGGEQSGLSTPNPSSHLEEGAQATTQYTLHNYGAVNPAAAVHQPRSCTGVEMAPAFVRSGAPPPVSFVSEHDLIKDESEPAEVFGDYSTDMMHPFYIGNSLASQLGGDEDWASVFLEEPAKEDQVWDLQIGRGSRSARSSLQHYNPTEHLEHENFNTGRYVDEYEEAARLLQTIGQDPSAL